VRGWVTIVVILWAWVLLYAPSYAVVAGFAIENLFKNQTLKFTARTFNPLLIPFSF